MYLFGARNLLTSNFIELKIFFEPKIFSDPKLFRTKFLFLLTIFVDPKFFRTKFFSDPPTNFQTQKSLQNNFSNPKFIWTQNIFGPKFSLYLNFLGLKRFLDPKFCAGLKFCSNPKFLWTRNFFMDLNFF